MTTRGAQLPAVAPLFSWPELVAIEEMERERRALKLRIERLPRCSYRRAHLTVRLQELTHRSLVARIALRQRCR